jgi:rhodanese-related sulfurtransferase
MLAGKLLGVHGQDISRHAYTLIVVTSPGCQFCANSAPFHRRVLAAARNARFPLLVAVPKSSSTDKFLEEKGLQGAPRVGWHDLTRRFKGTPSIVLVDSGGVIRSVWLGQLQKEKELEVLSAIRDPGHATMPMRMLTDGEQMLTKAKLDALSSEVRTTVISVQERDAFSREHPPGAINIPLEELGMRARRELSKDGLNVVDCSSLADPVCSITVEQLRKKGFKTSAVDLGRAD